MHRIDRADRAELHTIARLPLIALLIVGIVSAFAGIVLFATMTAPHGDGGCVVFDATIVAAVVTLLSGLFTALCALAHLRGGEREPDALPE